MTPAEQASTMDRVIITVTDAYRRIVLHALGTRKLNRAQVEENAAELTPDQITATLQVLGAEKRIVKNGSRWSVAAHIAVPPAEVRPLITTSEVKTATVTELGAKQVPCPTTVSKDTPSPTVNRTTVGQPIVFVPPMKPEQAVEELKTVVAGKTKMSKSEQTYLVDTMLKETCEPFCLEGSDRLEKIPASMARLRNRRRAVGNLWKPLPSTDPRYNDAVVPGFLQHAALTPEEMARKEGEAREREDQWWGLYTVAKQRKTTPPAPTPDAMPATPAAPAPAVAPKSKTITKAAKAAGDAGTEASTGRANWMGMPMTTFMRYCASRGMAKPQMIDLVINKLKLPPSKTTMNIQHSWGVKGIKLPTLSSEQLAAFDKLAAPYLHPATVPPVVKGPKAKVKK